MIARRCVPELETQTALAGSLMVQCQLGIMTVAWKTVDRYCMAFAYKQIATCGWGNCLLDAALARFASEARGRTALSSLPLPHIPQMLATNA